MYLSRLILNPRSRQVRNELADPYELHRTVCRAFPNANYAENESSGILFRVDVHPRARIPTLLVQSRQEPNWDFLAAEKKDYLLGADDLPLDVENPAIKEMNLQLQDGQVLSFRLRANPTKREKQSAKRIGLMREEDQQKWLARKLEAAGAELQAVTIVNEQIRQGKLPEKERANRMKFLSVQFDGVLQVRDPDLLLKSIGAGLGSGKGLGFGLLSLAKSP